MNILFAIFGVTMILPLLTSSHDVQVELNKLATSFSDRLELLVRHGKVEANLPPGVIAENKNGVITITNTTGKEVVIPTTTVSLRE